jgi:hypothetical protein
MSLNTSDPNAVRQAARQIVNQPQFASQRATKWDRFIFYATHPIDLFSLIFSWFTDAFLNVVGHVAVAAVLAAIIAAVVIVVVVRYGRSTTRNSAVQIHYVPTDPGKSVKELLSEADALERDGKWRDAIRIRYSGLILALSEQSIVHARSGRTTGEYVNEVTEAAPGAAAPFGQATRIFEWVWYGNGTATSDHAAEFKLLAAQVTQKVAA